VLKKMTGMMVQLVGALTTIDNNMTPAAMLLSCSGFGANIAARHSLLVHDENLANRKSSAW